MCVAADEASHGKNKGRDGR